MFDRLKNLMRPDLSVERLPFPHVKKLDPCVQIIQNIDPLPRDWRKTAKESSLNYIDLSNWPPSVDLVEIQCAYHARLSHYFFRRTDRGIELWHGAPDVTRRQGMLIQLAENPLTASQFGCLNYSITAVQNETGTDFQFTKGFSVGKSSGFPYFSKDEEGNLMHPENTIDRAFFDVVDTIATYELSSAHR